LATVPALLAIGPFSGIAAMLPLTRRRLFKQILSGKPHVPTAGRITMQPHGGKAAS
jgi:hypothetical protein